MAQSPSWSSMASVRLTLLQFADRQRNRRRRAALVRVATRYPDDSFMCPFSTALVRSALPTSQDLRVAMLNGLMGCKQENART
jgi:hypothetical protein